MANNTIEETSHYIAEIHLIKVTTVSTTDYNYNVLEKKRSKHSLARVIVSDTDLDGLIGKANQHLKLIEDQGDIDDNR